MDQRIGHMAEPDGRSTSPSPQEDRAAGPSARGPVWEVAAQVERNLTRSTYIPAFAGTALIIATIVHVAWLFWAIAPRRELVLWLVYVGSILAALMAGLLAEPLMRSREPDLTQFWRKYSRYLMSALNVGIAGSVWIFLPGSGTILSFYLVLLYVWYLTVQLLVLHSMPGVVGPAVVLVTGSLTIYWFTHGFPMREPVAVFLVLFSATLLLLRQAIGRIVLDAVTSRHQAEAASQRLQIAISEVADERDSKTRFIAAASHDLQQPIQAARLYFEQLVTADSATRARVQAGGREAFRVVQTLLEDMLEHLRLDAGAVAPRSELVGLNKLQGELAVQYAAAADAAGIEIVIQPTTLTAFADRRLLRRALGNLIDNAIKHSGGQRVVMLAKPKTDGWVEITVADDGGGVSLRDADRMFESDFSFRQNTGSSGRGFGLGLPSARRIVELLGGHLELSSSTSRGCEFKLILPAEEALGTP